MCRLFGFKSFVKSQVHSSLVAGKDSFMSWSRDHPDGWGLAYYLMGVPHIIKSTDSAINDGLFTKVSGRISSEVVVAHIRKATAGITDLVNTHPFQYGPWIFAHNGNIKNFKRHEAALMTLVSPNLLRTRLGETDSELFFLILMTEFAKDNLHYPTASYDYKRLIEKIEKVLRKVQDLVGPLHPEDGPPEETYFTFILSDGRSIIGLQGGKSLYYSSYKTRCAERNICPSFKQHCEAETASGLVSHFLLSSQKIAG